jgi:hypothetical protein
MRKFRSLFLMLLTLASTSFLTSCGDEEEVNPPATITFSPSAESASLAPGAHLKFDVVVTSTDKLKSFKASMAIPGLGTADTTVTSFPGSGFVYNIDDVVPPLTAGTVVTFTFTATTNNDIVTTRTFTLTVLSDLATYNATILGNQNASVGSFFSSTDGTVLTSANAKTNSGKVDLVYYYSVGGNTDLATIAAPTDPTAQAVYGATTSANIPSWATKNATQLVMGVAADFTSTNAIDVQDAFTTAAGTPGTKVNKLKVNDVILFKTAANKYGVAKVTSVTTPVAPANQSEIKLDFKVQR